jgi:hypothetical protein
MLVYNKYLSISHVSMRPVTLVIDYLPKRIRFYISSDLTTALHQGSGLRLHQLFNIRSVLTLTRRVCHLLLRY